MHTCVRIRARMHVHTYTCTHTCTHIQVHAYMCTRACARIHVHANKCTHTCVCIHVRTCMCIHTCARIHVLPNAGKTNAMPNAGKKTLCRTEFPSHVILTRSQCHPATAERAKVYPPTSWPGQGCQACEDICPSLFSPPRGPKTSIFDSPDGPHLFFNMNLERQSLPDLTFVPKVIPFDASCTLSNSWEPCVPSLCAVFSQKWLAFCCRKGVRAKVCQDGAKVEPRWSQDAPRWSQHRPKWNQDGAIMSQNASKMEPRGNQNSNSQISSHEYII